MGVRWHQTCCIQGYVLQPSPPLSSAVEIRQIHWKSCNLCGVFCDEANPALKSKLCRPGLGQAASPTGPAGDRQCTPTLGFTPNQNKKIRSLKFWLSNNFVKRWHRLYNLIWTLCAYDLNTLIIIARSCHWIFFLSCLARCWSQSSSLSSWALSLAPQEHVVGIIFRR